MTYLLWSPDDFDESGAREIDAGSPADAACLYAERYDRDDWNEDERRTYHVRDADGRLWSVEVRGVLEWSWRTGAQALIEEHASEEHAPIDGLDPGDEDRRLVGPWCDRCGDAFDAPERPCPSPAPGEPYKDSGRGGHMFTIEERPSGRRESR